MRAKCPNCKGKNIRVIALVTVRLIVDDDFEVEGSEPVDGDHEFDGDSRAFCNDCDFAAIFDAFGCGD